MTIKAIWNNKVIAETNASIIVEGNHYFPPTSLKKNFFEDSKLHSTCPIKGEASYFSISIDNKRNEDAAWYYPHPNPGYEKIQNHVAFWKGVIIENDLKAYIIFKA